MSLFLKSAKLLNYKEHWNLRDLFRLRIKCKEFLKLVYVHTSKGQKSSAIPEFMRWGVLGRSQISVRVNSRWIRGDVLLFVELKIVQLC